MLWISYVSALSDFNSFMEDIMKAHPFILLALIGCEDVLKSNTSQANYECFLTIDGIDNSTGAEALEIVDSTNTISCATESEKNEIMNENCVINEAGIEESYSDLSCDWECIEQSSCN